MDFVKAIRTDKGPEFTSRALDRWANGQGVDLKLIAAGKPTQNVYIESFNSKFHDECLNDHYFNNLLVSATGLDVMNRGRIANRVRASEKTRLP